MSGHCLPSQELRELIIQRALSASSSILENGKFTEKSLEDRIQPSSFEPQLADEAFILDTETKGIFRPQAGESIYRTLLQLPGRQRQKVSIANGFEIKKGFTYLLPLAEKVKLGNELYIKSSPKSSFGRLFLNTRLLADYNPCYDEIHGCESKMLDLWLLIQPLPFNLIIYPQLSLNQLRFFVGDDAQLTASELKTLFAQSPLLNYKRGEELFPAIPVITEDGLQIHLDLTGTETEGIVALRARHNPNPIDLHKTEAYDAEHFFEPMMSKDKSITIRRGEYYLLSSKEVLTIPADVNVELESHSHIGITGPLHFAGFVDNSFRGDLVFEVRSDEVADMELSDSMPVSKLKTYRTGLPDKLYGQAIGSHYQGQIGPKPAKFFKPFDFAFAARNHTKLDRQVLVQDARMLTRHQQEQGGFEFVDDAETLFSEIKSGFFQSRYDCEFDELLLQPIPYAIIFGPEQKVFSYIRTSNIKHYGDTRLFNKHSIGLGGHIITQDVPDVIRNCLRRELGEEVTFSQDYSSPKLLGTLMAYDKPVDRVHFGLIYGCFTIGSVQPREASIKLGEMISIQDLLQRKSPHQEYETETWSKMLVPHLAKMYEMIAHG